MFVCVVTNTQLACFHTHENSNSNTRPTLSIESHNVCTECYSALKIQDAWRKYQNQKIHARFVYSSLVKIVARQNVDTSFAQDVCSRSSKIVLYFVSDELLENETDDCWDGGIPGLDADDIDQTSRNLNFYDQGYEDWKTACEEEFQPRMREEIDIATQKAYDDGIVQGSLL